MAYISTEKAAQIRKRLKEEFPEIKFSVALGSGKYSLDVTILKSPYEFRPVDSEHLGYVDVNQYWVDSERFGYRNVDILKRIIAICNDGNWDRSDVMSDYFDVGWYLHLYIGKWDKPFELVAPAKKLTISHNTVNTQPSYAA